MDKPTEKMFCVSCCQDLPPEEFTEDNEKYICDKCCQIGLEFALRMAKEMTGERQLIIGGD